MTALTLISPAKLNLMLHITGRRADGYHLLQTVFQLLDYGDTMWFEASASGPLTAMPALAGVAPEDNLILRAAHLLREYTGSSRGATITIDKVLPMGGGLGGGSSNAATTLLALNHLWDCRLDLDQLAELGQQLGADVPIFVRGRSAWGEGVGEQLQPLEIPESWYLVIKPGCEVSTAQIFCHRELTRDTAAITIPAFFEQGGHNDCEAVVRSLYPEVDRALNWLTTQAPHSTARLTGTGACVFARFPERASAQRLLDQLPDEFEGFIARGVNHSPVHAMLTL